MAVYQITAWVNEHHMAEVSNARWKALGEFLVKRRMEIYRTWRATAPIFRRG